jgi:four helix bundle protein
MRDYTKIVAWQKADDLAVSVYEASRTFPKDELYSLTSQLRRSAYSVPANITEGASRDSKKDYLHFLYIARGSLNETRYFVHLAGRLGYLRGEDARPLQSQSEEAARILTGLIQAVESEAGALRRVVAQATSLVAMALGSAVVAGIYNR